MFDRNSSLMVRLSMFFISICLSMVMVVPAVQAQETQSTIINQEVEREYELTEGDVLVPPRLDAKVTEFRKARILTLEEEVQQILPADADYHGALPPEQQRKIQNIEVEMLEGPERGIVYKTVNVISNQPRDLFLSQGDIVIVNFTTDTIRGTQEVFVIDHARSGWSWLFVASFLIALFAFGGKKGLTSAVSLLMTVGLLLFVFVPGIMQGYNPILLSVVIAIIVTVMIHILIAGFTPKSYASMIGTIGGTVLASLLAAWAMQITHLFGMSSEEARVLFLDRPTLDFRGVFLASIVIGSLGAVMDVGISISAAIKEVRDHHPNPTFADLYRSGMNVGRDILGTMTDTLILAYIGAALPSLLLLVHYNNWNMALNYDFIAEEVIRSIAGSFGLLAAIPLTAYFAAWFESRFDHTSSSK